MRPEVEAASDGRLQERLDGTAWTACDSWYRTEQGRIVANWPGYMREYEESLKVLDPTEFGVVPLAERTPAEPLGRPARS